ncbi:5525_t:CDS:2 [Rhizophagus irregularis]|nr:5525_t:CDS:2 [Rhizophagus irregularis]
MGKKPFIDRKNAKYFQVVHRSQRDPLINDNEASSRVLVEVVPSNLRGKSKQIVEHNDFDDYQRRQKEIESRVGQAALYGVYFDDTEYDYLQHLKQIGENEGEAVFVDASKKEKKTVGNFELKKSLKSDDNKDVLVSSKKDRKVKISLPEEVLPSKEELPVGFLNQSAIPEDIQGFQPDMDPKLRETTTGGYSMTSSIMFRNDKLRLLDEQFEKISKEYIDDDDESDDESTSSQIRQDFSQILDEFLDKYEINGRKVVQKLEGDNAQDQLETIRQGLGKVIVNDDNSSQNETIKEEKRGDIFVHVDSEEKDEGQNWDCQSILINFGKARSKNEPKEEKKLRKQNIKSERKKRRTEKKSLKQAFAKEHTKQNKISHNISKNHLDAIHLD